MKDDSFLHLILNKYSAMKHALQSRTCPFSTKRSEEDLEARITVRQLATDVHLIRVHWVSGMQFVKTWKLDSGALYSSLISLCSHMYQTDDSECTDVQGIAFPLASFLQGSLSNVVM